MSLFGLFNHKAKREQQSRLIVRFQQGDPFVLEQEDYGELQDIAEDMYRSDGCTGYTIEYADGTRRTVGK
jgi:hypothetical protein